MSDYFKDRKDYKHESYGMISVSKMNGGEVAHFGSDLKTSNNICLNISEGAMCIYQHSNHKYFHSNGTIVEISMTPNQYAEMLSSGMNTSGVPCTITRRDGVGIIKYKEPFDSMENEKRYVNDKILALQVKSNALSEKMDALSESKTPIKKTEFREITKEMNMLDGEISSNLDYYLQCFKETMAKIVTDAKTELVSFANQNKLDNNVTMLSNDGDK